MLAAAPFLLVPCTAHCPQPCTAAQAAHCPLALPAVQHTDVPAGDIGVGECKALGAASSLSSRLWAAGSLGSRLSGQQAHGQQARGQQARGQQARGQQALGSRSWPPVAFTKLACLFFSLGLPAETCCLTQVQPSASQPTSSQKMERLKHRGCVTRLSRMCPRPAPQAAARLATCLASTSALRGCTPAR